MDVDQRLAESARAGDLEALMVAVGEVAADDPDPVAYRWLCVASDFGHEEADAMVDDLLELGSLRYDDDNFGTGHAHYENAVAYFSGTDGLPLDPRLGAEHVVEMRRRGYPDGIQDGNDLLATARASLPVDSRAAWDAALSAPLA